MNLYLIRHAEAQPLGAGDIHEDGERPLTAAGREQSAALAAALQRHGVQLGIVAVSPLLRARQTAEGLMQHWNEPRPQLQTCSHLAPGGRRRKLTRFLDGLNAESVALVGHMPDLALYAAWLIGSRKAHLDLAKTGVAHIEFADGPGKGAGTLIWLLTPAWYEERRKEEG